MPRKTLVFELCSELEQELVRQQLCVDTLKRYRKIEQLFFRADRIHPNCRNSHIFYPVLFRTLYGTGMRISEALTLTMEDVDLKEQTLHIVNPKNHKDRLLPISDSITEYCRWYQEKIHPVYHKDDLFFMSNRGTGSYSRNNVQVFFSRMIADADIPTHGYKGGGPHLHCLRHYVECFKMVIDSKSACFSRYSPKITHHFISLRSEFSICGSNAYLRFTLNREIPEMT